MNYSEIEQEIKNHNERMIAIEAKFTERQRTDDRILHVAWAFFGLAVAVILALVGANIFFNYKISEHDKQKLHDDLMKEVEKARKTLENRNKDSVKTHFENVKQNLMRHLNERMNWIDNDGRAYTLGHIADISLSMGEIERSLDASINLFEYATRSNTNNKAHALDKIFGAFESAKAQGYHIRDQASYVDRVERILQEYPASDTDTRVVRLRNIVRSYKGIQ
jgi:hypothetical protein